MPESLPPIELPYRLNRRDPTRSPARWAQSRGVVVVSLWLNRSAIVLLALIPWTVLVVLAVVGHVVMDRINFRKDRQFYAEMVKVRADL